MTYTEPLFNQVSRFATSVGFGFIICILYFVLFFIRKVISDKKSAVIIQDVVFGITGTIMSFFYMVIYNNGEVRFNLLIGEVTGAAVLYLTAGKYIKSFLGKTAVLIRRIIGNILLPLRLYFNALISYFKKAKSGIKESKSKKRAVAKDDTEKEDKKKRKNKENKKQKRKNNPLKPLKNQNKSV